MFKNCLVVIFMLVHYYKKELFVHLGMIHSHFTPSITEQTTSEQF